MKPASPSLIAALTPTIPAPMTMTEKSVGGVTVTGTQRSPEDETGLFEQNRDELLVDALRRRHLRHMEERFAVGNSETIDHIGSEQLVRTGADVATTSAGYCPRWNSRARSGPIVVARFADGQPRSELVEKTEVSGHVHEGHEQRSRIAHIDRGSQARVTALGTGIGVHGHGFGHDRPLVDECVVVISGTFDSDDVEALVAGRGDLGADVAVVGEATDVGHEHSRLTGNVGAHVHEFADGNRVPAAFSLHSATHSSTACSPASIDLALCSSR